MRSRVSLLFLVACCACEAGQFAVISKQPGAWPAILESVGHVRGEAATADILVGPDSAARSTATILEGASPLAERLGFKRTGETVQVVDVIDSHNPSLPLIWAKEVSVPKFDVPAGATVFTKDRWSGAPLVAGIRVDGGAVLWVATSPGELGYERFPYLMQALSDLGYATGFRSRRLWSFFDYSYRTRADADYLAARWRASGISALHVAAWHFYDRDPGRDEYLGRLIEAAHRHGVLVYAWIELPHVSEKFWAEHPEWREKTALGQDAQLDWRKLMNLQNRECAAAVRGGLTDLVKRFDWDGVNFAELYFESLEGAANPARFTPMNDDVRAEFKRKTGLEPVPGSRAFLDFRAELAQRMQEEWLGVGESFRAFRPDLDIVLTHVDDRFDTGMTDAIGADSARVLPLLDKHSFSFLIEDPATIWNLGPSRYPEIARRYSPYRLSIDINIVERYQDVYPTKQQTGTELFELVHAASGAFRRVALYFENSILKPDLELLASAAASVTRFERTPSGFRIEAASDVEVKWPEAGAKVDGRPWPLVADGMIRLPAGSHVVEPAPKADCISLVDLNADLLSASIEGGQLHFEYTSDSRAIAQFDRTPKAIEVDGKPATSLPRGKHRVVVY